MRQPSQFKKEYAMKELTKEVEKDIQQFIENNQPQMYWDHNDISEKTIEEILEKGIDGYLNGLYDWNLDYIWEMEQYLINELQNEWDEYDPDEIEEFSREFICVDMNTENLLSNIPDLTCQAYIYSNYDCCNSMDRFEDGGYLPEVFKRVEHGVKKDDYMDEFYNGAYGGCVFCFAFKTDIKTIWEWKEKIKTGKEIFIPKGTQFGFFSSFQGAGTPFEKTTYQNMTIPLEGETEYDNVGITVDIQQSYSMSSVYGDTSFVDSQDVEIR
jgi:hypothetical protein